MLGDDDGIDDGLLDGDALGNMLGALEGVRCATTQKRLSFISSPEVEISRMLPSSKKRSFETIVSDP